jgi:DNA-binding response OmpR family regulator/EAL domain-containing protein (putative c-di-GMP-specific phosphodiesterase class I)
MVATHPAPHPHEVSTPAWRSELAVWCEAFLQLLAQGWQRERAAALFERIETQTALNELVAEPALADAATELTVYLCTFAEGNRNPDDAQCLRMRELATALQQALAPQAPTETAHATHVQPRPLRIHYLRPREREQPGLASALGQHKLLVQPFEDAESALRALAKEPPDAVILEGSLLKALPALIEALRRQSAGEWRRVLWAAVGVEDDLQLRLYARRAGIDLLLETNAPERAAAAVMAALLRRREQAYRILIVEDDPSQVVFCGSLLRHQGYEVEVAENAAQGFERAQAHAPDLMLLDINLPDMSGVELAQLMREQHSLAHVPIVFLTGENDMDVRAEAIAAGGDDFISKPVRPRHLIANVNVRIGRARALAAAAQAEPIEESLSPRLDRVRFVEALENRRRESTRCVAVAVLAMDDVATVAARLGFVRAGDLALQLALAIEAETREWGPTCGIGEFSRLLLFEAESEFGLRRAIGGLCARLESRAWLSSTLPLRLRFSAGVVRYDGAPLDPDAVIAATLEQLESVRKGEGRGIALRNLATPDGDSNDPMRRVVRLMLSQPLAATAGRLQFRPLLPLRGTRTGQFLVRTLLLPPGSRRAAGIGPDVYEGIAGALGAHAALDRLSLQLVSQYSRSALVASHGGWRVLLPVSDVTLQEPFFAEWVQRLGLSPSQLLLVVGAARLRAGAGLTAAIDRLASRGWHWVLDVDEPDALERGALTMPNLDALMLQGFDHDPARWSAVVGEAHSFGKSVIACGPEDLRQVASLFAAGVHYALGNIAGDWADEPQYDATQPREL